MANLLEKYDVQTVLIVIILFVIGLKQIFEGIEYFWKKIVAYFNEKNSSQQLSSNLETRLDAHEQKLQKLESTVDRSLNKLDSIIDKMNLLMESDKDDIKAYITKEYHYFTEQKGWIDDYSLDCLERRYKHYVSEGGNSFAEGCMDALRALPRTPPA